MGYRLPNLRRARANGAILLATFAAACLAGYAAPTNAQSIIQGDAKTSNSSFQSFSTEEPTKIAMFSDEEPDVVTGAFDVSKKTSANLPAPNAPAKKVAEPNYRIPFSFPRPIDSNEATAVELLCSHDQGATWYSYAIASPEQGRSVFRFDAPESGEYWFALKTYFKNGVSSYSSTRAYLFDLPEESFALRNDELDPADSFDSTLAAPQLLSQPDEANEPDESAEPLMINNAAFEEDELAAPNAPQNDSANALDEQEQKKPVKVVPHPGKLKVITFGKDQDERLMVTIRWFRPDEIDEQYRFVVKSFNVERAPAQSGPWTIIGEELDVNEKGYAWLATADEMKPFYIRTVVVDDKGAIWRDVANGAVDVSNPEVRAQLGAVKTPAPFPKAQTDDKEESNDDKESSTFIKNTASEVDDDNDSERQERGQEQGKLVTGLNPTAATAARPKRPKIPPPTNPNEFQINPLFTRGFSVLYDAAQTRVDVEPTAAKRSIFTPPDRAQRVAQIRPAERRRSAAQIAAARAREERAKLEEQAKYAKEHEMEAFEKKPELMEGRMFYIDSNGNMTTTPPPEMQQALGVNAEMLAQGWVPSNQANANSQTGNNAEEPLYMPRDPEAYDASARSGIANMSNNQYPSASTPGASPINSRYSSGSGQGSTPGSPSPGQSDGGYRAIPQTSYAPSGFGSAPSAFPPRPTVVQ